MVTVENKGVQPMGICSRAAMIRSVAHSSSITLASPTTVPRVARASKTMVILAIHTMHSLCI